MLRFWRFLIHGAALLLSIAQANLDYGRMRLRRRRGLTLEERATWLQRWCSVALRRIRVRVRCEGTPPREGLLAANHLSYLDIFVFSSITPCVFVAKQEVKSWPVFGFMSKMSGTIFIDRSRKADLLRAEGELQAALRSPVTTVLFPEGTSSDGSTVLPFYSSLFEPAIAAKVRISAAHISYEIDQGKVGEEVCYWGEMKLLPHVIHLLGLRKIRACVRFGAGEQGGDDRKEVAERVREQVVQLGSARMKIV